MAMDGWTLRATSLVFGLFLAASAAAKPARKPTPRVVLLDAYTDQDTTLSAAAVGRKVMSSYVDSLRRCYAPAADHRGTLTLGFAVTEAGKVSNPDVSSFDETLEDCVATAMGAWTFAKPRMNGQPITATFKLLLALDTTTRSKKELSAALVPAGTNMLLAQDDDGEAGAMMGPRAAPSHDDRPFTPELVLSKIQSTYLAGLRQCANRGPPPPEGGTSLSFDVDSRGAATQIRIQGAYPPTRNCMKSQIEGWSFPPPKSAPAHIAVPLTQ